MCQSQTCENLIIPEDCAESMKPECVCPKGKYLRGFDCVDIEECYQCVVDGSIKKAGETWSPEDTCDLCQCDMGVVRCSPIMEQPKCEEGEEITYDDGPCCGKCTPIKTCSLKTTTKTLHMNNCTSEEIEEYAYCSGYCSVGRSEPKLSGLGSLNGPIPESDECECCTGIPSGETRTITMKCTYPDGITEDIPAELQLFKGCSCNSNSCGGTQGSSRR